jgi:hypothetical protein
MPIDSLQYGWVASGKEWSSSKLLASRPDIIGGAASGDQETGHDRGLFGDNFLWNQKQFMQGSDQDIFKETFPIDLTIPNSDGHIVVNFDLTDSWYFEDFDSNGVFNPCMGGEVGVDHIDGCFDGAAWNPILPKISFEFVQ